MAKHKGAERAGEEGNAERQKRRQHLRGARGLREENRADDQRCGGGIHVEIVELDGRPDKAGSGHAGGRVNRFIARGFAERSGCGHVHIPDSYVPVALSAGEARQG